MRAHLRLAVGCHIAAQVLPFFIQKLPSWPTQKLTTGHCPPSAVSQRPSVGSNLARKSNDLLVRYNFTHFHTRREAGAKIASHHKANERHCLSWLARNQSRMEDGARKRKGEEKRRQISGPVMIPRGLHTAWLQCLHSC